MESTGREGTGKVTTRNRVCLLLSMTVKVDLTRLDWTRLDLDEGEGEGEGERSVVWKRSQRS